jgi:hypothetical protein
MWKPGHWSDVEALIGQAEETAYLDFKRELARNGRELAKDLAAMTVDGGVLLYGVEEDATGGVAAAIPKVSLKGQEERLRQVANSSIHPAPSFEVVLLREEPTDPDGVIAVVVPPSPLAPHEVDGRFPRRDGTTTKYLSEPEIDRLYQLRRHAGPSGGDPLDLLAIDRELPGIDGAPIWGPGKNVGLIRVAGRLSGDARHPADPWLGDSLLHAAELADEWLAPRSSVGRPFLLERMRQRPSWKADGVEGWSAGRATDAAAVVWQKSTYACVLRYPSHVLLQVTLPLSVSEEGPQLDYACAYEWRVALETVAGLAFLGNWFADFQSAGGCEVALGLRGFGDSVPYKATRASVGLDTSHLEPAPASMAEATATAAIELRESPDVVARRLLERWLASFYQGGDLFDQVLG